MPGPKYSTVTGQFESTIPEQDLSLAEKINRGQEYGNFGREQSMLGSEFKKQYGGSFDDVQEMLQDGFVPHVKEIKQRLGEEQSGASLMGAALYRALAGEVVGGTLEGTGYLLDMVGLVEMMDGDINHFGNALTELGGNIRAHAESATPIYGDTEDIGSAAWLAAGIPSVASSLSLLIPTGAAVKGISTLANAMKMMQNAGKLTKTITKGVTAATISRHMENMMEVKGSHEQTMQQLAYDNSLLQDGDPKKLSYDQIQEIADDESRTHYLQGYAALVQDIPQYILLGRGIKATGALKDVRLARAAGLTRAQVGAAVGKTIGWQMLTEGAEEAYQYAISEDATHRARIAAGFAEEKDAMSRYSGYFNNKMLSASIFGALGAGVMQTAGKPLMDKIQGIDDKAEKERLIGEINNTFENSKKAGASLLASLKSNNAAGIEAAERGMKFDMAYRSATNGQLDVAKRTIDTLINEITEEEAGTLELADDYKSRLESVKEEMDVVGKLYTKNSRKYEGALLEYVTKLEYNSINASKDLERLNKETDTEIGKISRANELSPEGRSELETVIYAKGLRTAKAQFEKYIASDSIKTPKEAAQRQLDYINSELSNAEAEIKDFENTRATSITEGGQGAIPANRKRQAEKDASIIKSANTNVTDEIASKIASRNWKEAEYNGMISDLKQATSPENLAAIKKLKEIREKELKDEEEALRLANKQLEADKADKAAKDSINNSREKSKDDGKQEEREGGDYAYNADESNVDEEKLAAIRAEKAAQRAGKQKPPEKPIPVGKSSTKDELTEDERRAVDQEGKDDSTTQIDVDDFTDAELLSYGLTPAEIKSAREAAEKKKHKDVVVHANIKERAVLGNDLPTTTLEDDVNEDPTKSIEGNTAMAELGAALAWISSTGMSSSEFTSRNYALAHALSKFLENPENRLEDYTVEFTVDLVLLQQSKDFVDLVQKVLNKEPLTKDELANLPIAGEFRDKEGNIKYYSSNGAKAKLKTTIHRRDWFDKKDKDGNFKLEESKRLTAKEENMILRATIYDAYIKNHIISTPIIEQRKGILQKSPNTADGKFSKNLVSPAVGVPIEEVQFIFGNGSNNFSTYEEGAIVTDPDLFGYSSAKPGAVYAKVIAANGEVFPLRVMIEDINDQEAEIVYDIYNALIKDKELFTTPLSSVHAGQAILAKINDSSSYRIKGIGEVLDLANIQFKDLLNFLVYEGKVTEGLNMPSLRIADGVVYIAGQKMAHKGFDSPGSKQIFMEALKLTRKRQIATSMLSNPAYKKYLEGAGIISTNAVRIGDKKGTLFIQPTTIVGEPTAIPTARATDTVTAAKEGASVAEQIVSASKNISKSADDRNYIYTNPDTKENQLLQRVSNWVGNNIELTKKNHELLKTSSIIGQVADVIVRDFFSGNLKPVEHYKVDSVAVERVMDGAYDANFTYGTSVSTTPVMETALSPEAYNELIAGLTALQAPGGFLYNKTIHSDRVMVADLGLKVAGELDLLVEDNVTGDLYIIDVKTMTKSKLAADGSIREGKFSEEWDGAKSSKQSYAEQQNAYRILIKRNFGKDVKGIFMLPVLVDYNKRTIYTKRAAVGNLYEFDQHDIKGADVKIVEAAKVAPAAKVTPAPVIESKVVTAGSTVTIVPTTKPAEIDIEVKKADIERRRQEELDKTNAQLETIEKNGDSFIRVKVEVYTTLSNEETLDEVEIITFKDGSRKFRLNDGKTGELLLDEKIKKENTTTNEQFIESFVGNLDNSLKKISEDSNPNKTAIDKINAKYDAELAALEEKPFIIIKPENITSKGSEFAKKLTNVGNAVGITYKGKQYVNSEHAYQTWKSGEFNQAGYNLKGGKVRGGKIGDTFAIMVDILTEKLKQHPDLVTGINERGGLDYIKKSTHNVIGDKFWESAGQNKFIEALAKAYENVSPTQQSAPAAGKSAIEELEELIDVEELTKQNKIIYTEEDGTICAEVGGRSSNITPGSKWSIVKDLKGHPTHEDGGVDLTIGRGGVKVTGAEGKFKARYGLVLPNK